MLIDKQMHPLGKEMSPAFLKWFSGARYSAMKFSLSSEVVTEIATILREEPSLVTHNLQFALPPFPETYIELNYMDLVKQISPENIWRYDEDTCDDQLAFYIKDNVITMFVSRRDDKDMNVAPLAYVLPQGGTPPGSTFALPIERETKLAHLLGTTYNHDKAGMTNEIADWLCSVQHRSESTFFRLLCSKGKNAVTEYIKCSMGEFRVAMACLLWLGQPTHYELADVPASRKIIRGKPTTYSAHRVVRLRHDAKKSFRQIKSALSDRAGPRRHQVRAFWRHLRLKDGCEHTWPVMPDENGHFVCTRCGGVRLRVQEHERGDAGKGFVTKEYLAR